MLLVAPLGYQTQPPMLIKNRVKTLARNVKQYREAAHQKVYKQGRYDITVKVNIQCLFPASFTFIFIIPTLFA